MPLRVTDDCVCRNREVYVYYTEAVWGGVTVGGVISRENFTSVEETPASEWDGQYPGAKPDWESTLATLEEELPW